MSKIDVNNTHPDFTFDVPNTDNLPGSLLFNESSDFSLIGLWRIYYQIYLNSETCVLEDNGSCKIDCSANPDKCNEDCTSLDDNPDACEAHLH